MAKNQRFFVDKSLQTILPPVFLRSSEGWCHELPRGEELWLGRGQFDIPTTARLVSRRHVKVCLHPTLDVATITQVGRNAVYFRRGGEPKAEVGSDQSVTMRVKLDHFHINFSSAHTVKFGLRYQGASNSKPKTPQKRPRESVHSPHELFSQARPLERSRNPFCPATLSPLDGTKLARHKSKALDTHKAANPDLANRTTGDADIWSDENVKGASPEQVRPSRQTATRLFPPSPVTNPPPEGTSPNRKRELERTSLESLWAESPKPLYAPSPSSPERPLASGQPGVLTRSRKSGTKASRVSAMSGMNAIVALTTPAIVTTTNVGGAAGILHAATAAPTVTTAADTMISNATHTATAANTVAATATGAHTTVATTNTTATAVPITHAARPNASIFAACLDSSNAPSSNVPRTSTTSFSTGQVDWTIESYRTVGKIFEKIVPHKALEGDAEWKQTLAFPPLPTEDSQFDELKAAEVACAAVTAFLKAETRAVRLLSVSPSPTLMSKLLAGCSDPRLQVHFGDICSLHTEGRPAMCIVNPTNWRFRGVGGGAVNERINQQAGPELERTSRSNFQAAEVGRTYPIALPDTSPLRAQQVRWVLQVRVFWR